MLRLGISSLALCLLISSSLFAQQIHKSKPTTVPGQEPGITTITSFDKDHTVIGWLELVPIESKIYHSTRMLRVLVPANYFSPHNRSRNYPVLYMQDAQNLFDESTAHSGEWHMDETVENLVGGFKIPPMFVVGIDNGGEKRSSEYLPYPDKQNSHDNVGDEKDVHGKEYSRFLMTEVKPFIEKRYRISRGALNTGIGGSSYGAVIALYTALQYPTSFGHLLLESPPLWIGDDQLLNDVQKAKQLPRKVYVGIGTEEGGKDADVSAQALKLVRELEADLRKKGLGPTRLKVVIEEGGQHNEGEWSKRLPEAMMFLYGP